MTRKLLAATLLALTVFPITALSGTTGKIAGEVKDAQTGEALPGVNVVIEGTNLGAASNLDGYYVILNIPPGTYTLTASAVGYAKKTIAGVQVSIDLTTKVDFAVSSTVIEKEEVVVTAERAAIRKDLTSTEARVTAGEISKLAVREVAEVLTLQAGVTEDRSGGIHIRGGRSSEVGYWVDGISVSDVYDGSQAVQVDNNAVQELQVISGTFNAEYGQAMSGIVNIVTKDGGQNFHGGFSSYIGDYLTGDRTFYNLQKFRPLATRDFEGNLSGPLGFPGITFYLTGRYFKSDGWLFGRKTFNPDGSLAPGADSILNAAGQLVGIQQADNPVPMNDRERFSGQMKLTFQITGDLKFALTGVGSRIDYRDYNHAYFLNPEGDVTKHDRGYNVSGLITHTLGSRSFYTVNLSFFRKQFKEYLYEDPFDPRYNLDPFAFNTNLYEYLHAGTNTHHFTRSTETRQAKIDFTSQVSNLHEIKLGVEGRLHSLYLNDYSVTPIQDTVLVNGVLTDIYRASIPPASSPLFQEYSERPIEFSAYVQDKLEYERMIVNVGVRFDYFNSRGKILHDPNDPNVYLPQKAENKALTLDERLAKWYDNASAKSSVSPRFGISYPITDRGVLHFSYGHFLQIPSFEYLFQNPGYKVNSVDPLQGVYGNADLKPQRTTMYEFGLQQQLSDVLSFDITGFYRDTRDWVSTSAKIPVGSAASATQYYTEFVNKDYANSRGVTLTVNKRLSDMFTFNLSYTFQTAEGVNSSPDEEQGALVSNNEPSKILTPLDWDQTHTVNFSLGVGQEDWGLYALGRYGSGLPYTPVINQAEARGEDAARVVSKNSRRQPGQLNVDLRAFKNFQVGFVNFSVFVKVFNVFDIRNEVYIYGQTGRATASPAQLGVAGLSQSINRINTVEDYLVRPDFYSEPREIQFGVDINF
jgi:outer membrane receptor for ferrienterochelin and colicin